MNKESMPLRSYSGLADEIKALNIKNNILKEKIKDSKRSIKVLVQRHVTNLHGKNIKIDRKMRFYTGIASVVLFNTIFTLIREYIPHTTYWKGPKYAMQIQTELEGKKRHHH